MLKIVIKKQKGRSLIDAVKTLTTELSQRQLERIARETEQIIKENIRASLLHPEYSSGHLENSFFAEKIGVNSWGIGNVGYLNENTPYWRHINYGSQEIGANWQHWLPKGYWQDGLWVVDSQGYYDMPKKPIEAHNYIEKTISEIDSIVKRNLKD